jgi:S-adenosylmethionine decarboxylase
MDFKGKHVCADITLEGAIPSNIYDLCYEGVLTSGMTIISESRKRFEPHGETVVFILSESHFTLHTYPEHNYLSIDCYTCGMSGNPLAPIQYLIDKLKPKTYKVSTFPRGNVEESEIIKCKK